MTLAELQAKREERMKLIVAARAILDGAETAKREMTPEENTSWDKLIADSDKLKTLIEKNERQLALDAEMDAPRERRAGREVATTDDDASKRQLAYKGAFRSYLCYGMEGLDPEQRAVLRAGFSADKEFRAPQGTPGAVGGYTIPQDFSNDLEKALKAFGGMREGARVLNTDSGATLPWPMVDDTANAAAIVGENLQSTETAAAFTVKNLVAFTYRSLILCSIELLQDSAFNLDAEFTAMLADRVGRGTNLHFTNGVGTTQPEGILTAATLGKAGIAGQTTSLTYDDLVDLEFSVDVAYRKKGAWMANDQTFKAVRKLKDSTGIPLWQPSIAAGQPDQISGHPYITNNDMPVMAISAKSLLFGDFSKYIVRDVRQNVVMRLTERYADFGQVGFMVFSRHDGRYLNAGSGPIKYYQNSAT